MLAAGIPHSISYRHGRPPLIVPAAAAAHSAKAKTRAAAAHCRMEAGSFIGVGM